MFIAMNKVAVPAEQHERVIAGFEHAAPHMKMFKGFLGLELWTDEKQVIWAISRWESQEDLKEYTNHPMFKQHHAGTDSSNQSGENLVTYFSGKVIS
ncbi:antibiotic biosynthesis monooxygenase family protein [Tengunoibacter tsumagoiensis]|uniref:ABM domain-containing protein n=1 Tax=Tengunoibacter tsumagoiensis TaxID=2014871 RepID=A0A401ZWJ9_9CHLR|nr:antibiotic biosynthesis monooxygenase [Tengunoibacter tsumagoiensis]GCE11186.1 hypothetical protein KTT_10450 [Tengunoibacter tsumagoiensis]